MSKPVKSSLARLAAVPGTSRPTKPAWDAPAPVKSVPAASSDDAQRPRGRPATETGDVTPYLLRLPASEYRRLTRVAADQDITLRELLRRGASLYLEQLGLSALER